MATYSGIEEIYKQQNLRKTELLVSFGDFEFFATSSQEIGLQKRNDEDRWRWASFAQSSMLDRNRRYALEPVCVCSCVCVYVCVNECECVCVCVCMCV